MNEWMNEWITVRDWSLLYFVFLQFSVTKGSKREEVVQQMIFFTMVILSNLPVLLLHMFRLVPSILLYYVIYLIPSKTIPFASPYSHANIYRFISFSFSFSLNSGKIQPLVLVFVGTVELSSRKALLFNDLIIILLESFLVMHPKFLQMG